MNTTFVPHGGSCVSPKIGSSCIIRARMARHHVTHVLTTLIQKPPVLTQAAQAPHPTRKPPVEERRGKVGDGRDPTDGRVSARDSTALNETRPGSRLRCFMAVPEVLRQPAQEAQLLDPQVRRGSGGSPSPSRWTFRLSSNGCGWVEARSAGRRGVLAARVASELTAHGVHLTGGGRGAPWPGVGRSGVAAGRPACQRATRVLRCATALRVTHRPSLRSSSRYGPCGPAWTGASRPSTTTRKARRLAVRG